MRAPVDLRAIVGLVREARHPTPPARPIHVSGPLASTLVAELATGGRPGLVRVGAVDGACVHVRILGGAPSDEDLAVLRHAARALVPVVGVQTSAWDGSVPYVPASDLVDVPAGSGFPVDRIARAIAAAAGDDAVALAAGLPVLAGPVRVVCIARTAATVALVAGTPLGGSPDLPVIATAQTRMLGALRRAGGGDVTGADPEVLARAVGPEVAVPLLAGLAARTIVRRVRPGGAALRAGVAAGLTLGLGAVATRLSGGAYGS